MALSAAQIGEYGERHVAAWLQSQGYKTNQDTKLLGSTDIEANGAETILVQVKTAVSPSVPASLSSDEIRNIKARATKLGRTAYQAQVTIDSSGKLIGEVKWKKL